MAVSRISGPSHTTGPSGSTSQGNHPDFGPSITYQGGGFSDPAFPYENGQTGAGYATAFLDMPYNQMVDAVPAALGAAKIAAAQAATVPAGGSVALTLVSTASAGIQPNAPIVPSGSGVIAANVVSTLALDPGFSTVATTNSSAVVTFPSAVAMLRVLPGLTLAIAQGTSWVLARVKSVSGLTATLDAAMTATAGAAVVALANGAFRNDQTPVALSAWLTRGAGRFWDPRSGIARGWSVTSNNAGDTGYSVTLRGYSKRFEPMTETVNVAANSVAYGKKAFGYVASATLNKTGGGTLAGTVSIGTSDLFGFHLRADLWENTNIFWAGAFAASSTGFVAADTTSPATATTGDVRGTVQLSAAGPTGNFVTGGASDGSKRLAIYMSIPLDNLSTATPSNTAPLLGVTQA